MALNNVGRKSPRRIEAEQRGEIIDRAPTGGGDGVYHDYFAEFDDSNSRRDDRWGGRVSSGVYQADDARALFFRQCAKGRAGEAALLAES